MKITYRFLSCRLSNFAERLVLLTLLLILVNVPAVAGPGDRFERMVMPGDLSTAHAKYEKDCDKCHKSFEKGAQNELCMDCHKEVKVDVQDKIGMHGKLRDVEKRKCSVCHPDHKGRDAMIAPFDRDTFDHKMSDFPLQGTHNRLSCNVCHKVGEKYRKASGKCFACHEEDDPHGQRLGKVCHDCHIETVWGEAYYDHEKTDFPLRATHRHVACADCHPNERYKDTPQDCMTCHRLDDKHQGDNGKKCQDCHNEALWLEIKFDHDKDTKYPLTGRHVSVDCQACHKGDVYKKINNDCVTCHKKEDAHQGLFGDKCHDCHVTRSWTRTVFNHTKDTKYELSGAHKKITCVSCHRGDVYADLKTDCISCHKKDDVHEGQEGTKCDQCHKTEGWNGQVFFDHDLTKFPLLDSHAIVPCEDCHMTPAYQAAEVNCRSCHMKDDAKIHKKRLGLNCELCHNANDWKKWVFNHDKQTKYPLDGAHKNLNCNGCHTTPVEKEIKLSKKCAACHDQDDRHHGSFGKECERCHITEAFSKIAMRR